jgi:copper chaperone NosL
MSRLRRMLTVAVIAGQVACAAPGPVAIAYDHDACDHCRMAISDPRFAAQIVTRTGKVFRFDDPSCLTTFLAGEAVVTANVHSIWFNDHATPEQRVRAEEAVFVVSDALRAPMNGRVAAFTSREEAAAFALTVAGRLETWGTVAARGRS